MRWDWVRRERNIKICTRALDVPETLCALVSCGLEGGGDAERKVTAAFLSSILSTLSSSSPELGSDLSQVRFLR